MCLHTHGKERKTQFMDHGIEVAEELYEVFLHDSSDKYGKYVETQD